MKFKEWFERKLMVGGMPNPELRDWHPSQQFSYVINVSDEYYHGEAPMYDDVHYFWFPISEQKKDMGINSIFGALVILWQAEHDNKPVYLHCHSGSNRSWTVAAAYWYMRTGEHLYRPVKSGPHDNKLLANCDRHYLPPRAEMEDWLNAVRDELKTGMKPGILTMSKIEAIKNF